MASDLATPFRTLLDEIGLELYDVELSSGVLNVTVTRTGGVDLDALTNANHVLSAWLDNNDPIPGRYTLDVSSPGLERKLRTPEHFASARGTTITLRECREGQPTRRLEGELVSCDTDSLVIADETIGETTVQLSDIERARTVFAWGATTKPSPSKGKPAASNASRRK